MNQKIISELVEKGFVTKNKSQILFKEYKKEIVSVYMEIRSLFFIGVLLFSAGLGMIVYENLNQVGHFLLLSLLLVGTVFINIYLYKRAVAFTWDNPISPSPYFDYLTLLSAVLLSSSMGYFTYLIPASENYVELLLLTLSLVLIYQAYRFNHQGVLAMGLLSLIGFFGITVNKKDLFDTLFFESSELFFTGLVIGLVLLTMGILTKKNAFKPQFYSTFLHMGFLLLYSNFSHKVFTYNSSYLHTIGLLLFSCIGVFAAIKFKKPILLLYSTVISYIALTMLLFMDTDFGNIEIIFFYFIISSIGLILFIIQYIKFIKSK